MSYKLNSAIAVTGIDISKNRGLLLLVDAMYKNYLCHGSFSLSALRVRAPVPSRSCHKPLMHRSNGILYSVILSARSCACRKPRPFDLVTESPSLDHDGRADILPLEPGYLALQAQEPSRSGECCPQAPGDGTAAQGARSGPVHQQRSAIPHRALSLVPVGSQGHDDPAAGDRRALASCRFSPLLAPEIPLPGRPAANIDLQR